MREEEIRKGLVKILRTPPNTKVYHKDRFDWTQAELVADEILEFLSETFG